MFLKAALSLSLAISSILANVVAGNVPEMNLYVMAGMVEANRYNTVALLTDDGNEWYAEDRPDLHAGDRVLITLHDNNTTDDVCDDYIVSIDVVND